MGREYHRVDLNTGRRLSTAIFNEGDEIPSDYVEGWGGNKGFYDPIYDFNINNWVEGKREEEIVDLQKKTKQEEIDRQFAIEMYKNFESANGHTYSFDKEDEINFTQAISIFSVNPAM